MSLKLYVFPPSPRSFKVMALAAHLGLEHELCVVDLGKGENMSAEFAAINPNRRVPALEENGFVLWEANAILQYLAAKRPERGLLPADPASRALVAQWQFWDLAHWEAALTPIIWERCVKVLLELGEPDASEIERGLAAFGEVAPILDGHLQESRFTAGSQPTIADFSLGATLNLSEMIGLPLDAYPHIRRWYRSLVELPGWRESMVRPPCNALESATVAA
nr:glutathione S-transferase family protein [uncultured Steroidobacter sp.]